MNTPNADDHRSGLVFEENKPRPDYANFTFYGIHTHKFIDWTNEATKGPGQLVSEGQAGTAQDEDDY